MKEKIVETESKLTVDQVEILFGTPKGILDQYIKRENLQTTEDSLFHQASSLKNSLEQYIYTTKEKLESVLKGYFTEDEKKNLTQYMDKLMEWLYSEDEKLYDMKTLEEKSKDMKTLGDEIYNRNKLWLDLENNFVTFEGVVNELSTQWKTEKEKLEKKQFTYVTAEDITKIEELINNAITSAKKKRELSDPAPRIQKPPVDPTDVSMLYDVLKVNVKKIYDDAEFKVKEAERKKKEEEEKKKKEEEEKKKKEEEEENERKRLELLRLQKEEEEKKKQEEEEAKKKQEEEENQKKLN
jgi:hypothetical protein